MRTSRLGLFRLPALLSVVLAATAARGETTLLDEPLEKAVAEARSIHGVGVYTALRKVWKRWDQTDPAQVEAALAALETDTTLRPEHRAYAGMLAAYGRRRRGDLEGAKKRLGELGFVSDWMIVGPFDNEGKGSLGTPFGPELDWSTPVSVGQTFDGKERPVQFRAAPAGGGFGWLDLAALVRPSEKVCAYATTVVHDKNGKKRDASVWIGASGAFRAFWNGVEVLADPAYRELEPERWAARVSLGEGENRLTVKVCGDESGPLLAVRLADGTGAPDPNLQTTIDRAAFESAAKKAVEKKQVATAIGVSVRQRGGGKADAEAATPKAWGGALADLATVLDQKRLDPPALEAHARYLAMTGGDDPGSHVARDLAYRAADAAPTLDRLLLAAELAEDRNARTSFLIRARQRVRDGEDDTQLTLAEGLNARESLNWRDAIPYFDRVLARDPGNIAAVLGRVELYSEAGLRQTALVTLEDAVTRHPHSVALLRALAGQLRTVGRQTDAEDVEARYAQLRFDDPTYLRGKVELAIARRDADAGTRWLERLLALDPNSFASVDYAAQSFRKLGQAPRALSLLKQRVDAVPTDVDALRAYADMQGEEGHRDEQLKLLKQVLVLRPQAKDVRAYLENAEPPKVRRDEAFAFDKDAILALAKEPKPRGFPKRTLRDLSVTTVYPNGLASRFHQVAFQPLTDDGAASARQYAFGFQSDRETVDLRMARVYHANGTVDEAIETGEGADDDPSIASYSSSRTFYVQLPRLSPDDVVELRYRVEEVTPRNEFGDSFSEQTYVSAFEPVSSSEVVLLTPKQKGVRSRVPCTVHAGAVCPDGAMLPGFTKEEKDDGDTHLFRVVGKNLTPLSPEPAMPPLAEVAASVTSTTFGSWDDVGRWFWGLAKDQFDADDTVRAKVKELTKGLTDDREKVRAVYDFVVQRTRYVALEFGIEGFRPRRCAQTLGRGWGDCKDKATVIVTMLRELGIPANIVLVRTGMRGRTNPDVPSYAMFDHAIAYVPKFDLFLDGTAEYTGMSELPAMDRGAMGLIVSEGGAAKLVTLPVPAADQTMRVRKVDVQLADGAAAQMDLHEEATGALAAEYRVRYHAKATQRLRVTEDLAAEIGGLTLGEGARGLEVNDLENVEAPVKIHAKGGAQAIRKGDDGWVVTTAPIGGLTARFAALSTRTFDVRIPFATVYEDEWTIHLPAGTSVKRTPETKKIESPFGSIQIDVDASQPGKHVVKTRVTLAVQRVSVADYPAFRQFCEAADRALADRVNVSK